MNKNWISGSISEGITLSAAVPTAAEAGDVTHIGAADSGLYAYLVTERGTADGPNAVGITSGRASVRLLPTQAVVELPVTGDAGDAVYSSISGGDVVYSTSGSSTNYHIGHIVDIPGRAPASDNAFVFLGSATAAPGSAG